jgi:tetratricopeptide (TPR) repeat protein
MRNRNTIWMMILCILLGAQGMRAQSTAQDCYQAKNPADVIAGCTDLISSGRGDGHQRAQLFFLRGRAHAMLKEPDMALADYGQAVTLDPDRVDIYLDRGYLQLGQKNYALARQEYQHVINTPPEELGSALQNAKDRHEVDRTLLFMEKGGAHLGLGFVSRALGDSLGARKQFSNATEIYSSVIEKSPADYDAYYERARVYQIQYRYPQANADYDQAAKLVDAKAATISDHATAEAMKDAAKDWKKAAEYSKTMAELDQRFEDYLQTIEKNNTYSNWSRPPWTAYRRAQLTYGEVPTSTMPAVKMPHTASPLPLLALSGFVFAVLGILLRAFRIRTERGSSNARL